ncbi:type IV fimbrial biogenesis protein FimT [Desulfurella multipotens]|uniref:Type IV fimbrial biogenesis protein FimT n=1 Tax=Desulfurella multipotens TaxID=79269 RepID=A0A1G6JR58_9BACT|nr:MAG: prepilin-type N-terminal cleavage/methylation domain-containing protein [Desulfurella multipotens]SDC21209.1 type IV fimbrial biogenesis protein FimT [Desulfurella multipotens]
MVGEVKAFTLLEVIVTIAILAIVLAIAIPNFNKYMKSFEITSQFNQIESDLDWSKTYAFTRKVQVSVVFSANSYTIFDSTNNKIIKGPINLKYSCSTNPANSPIIFYPLGYPTPASVYTVESNNPNCTSVSFTRIISGVYDGTSCTQ